MSSREIENLEVAVTGKLASMSRGEAVRKIAEAGGRYVSRPTPETALLAVGQGGPPLDLDGRPTRSLLRARELAASGSPIRVIPEQEFLGLLGIGERSEDIYRLYTTAQLARILEVPAAAIRSWVRQGLVEPVRTVNRLAFFDFHQVSVARALGELAQGGVGPARIKKSLAELAGWLGETSAAELDVLDTTDTLLVRLEDGSVAETSGQLRFSFEEESQSSAPPPFTLVRGEIDAVGEPLAGLPGEALFASPWFDRALRAEEEGDLDRAVRAYRRAIGEDGPTPESCFNLGNVLYGLERKSEAADAFAQATEVDRDHVEAWNNLGNVLVELERYEEAVRAFRRALAIEPHYADAHFNLASVLAQVGDVDGARRHYLDYLREDPNSPWADEVHDRLARLE